MDPYLIRRRHAVAPDEVEATVAPADAKAEKVPDQLRLILGYPLDEGGGPPGTTCIYGAMGPAAIRAHAEASGLRRRDRRGCEHRHLTRRAR